MLLIKKKYIFEYQFNSLFINIHNFLFSNKSLLSSFFSLTKLNYYRRIFYLLKYWVGNFYYKRSHRYFIKFPFKKNRRRRKWLKKSSFSRNPRSLFLTNLLTTNFVEQKNNKIKYWTKRNTRYALINSFFFHTTRSKYYIIEYNKVNYHKWGSLNRRFAPRSGFRGMLFNIIFGIKSKKYNNKPFKFRKKLYTLPDRNLTTPTIIRKFFRPKKRSRYSLNYIIGDKYLLNSNRRKRAYVPKIFFNNSIYMYLKKRRVSLNKYFNLRYLYQKKLSKFLYMFKEITTIGVIKLFNSTLFKMVEASSMLVNFHNIEVFFNNRWIYLNGCQVTYKKIFIFKNDLISFYFNWKILKYLIYSYKMINRNRYFLNRYYFLFLIKRRKRKHPRYWIKKYQEVKKTQSPFIEKDFFSLSFLIINEYNYKDFLFKPRYMVVPYGVLFNFNWKYIN